MDHGRKGSLVANFRISSKTHLWTPLPSSPKSTRFPCPGRPPKKNTPATYSVVHPKPTTFQSSKHCWSIRRVPTATKRIPSSFAICCAPNPNADRPTGKCAGKRSFLLQLCMSTNKNGMLLGQKWNAAIVLQRVWHRHLYKYIYIYICACVFAVYIVYTSIYESMYFFTYLFIYGN